MSRNLLINCSTSYLLIKYLININNFSLFLEHRPPFLSRALRQSCFIFKSNLRCLTLIVRYQFISSCKNHPLIDPRTLEEARLWAEKCFGGKFLTAPFIFAGVNYWFKCSGCLGWVFFSSVSSPHFHGGGGLEASGHHSVHHLKAPGIGHEMRRRCKSEPFCWAR